MCTTDYGERCNKINSNGRFSAEDWLLFVTHELIEVRWLDGSIFFFPKMVMWKPLTGKSVLRFGHEHFWILGLKEGKTLLHLSIANTVWELYFDHMTKVACEPFTYVSRFLVGAKISSSQKHCGTISDKANVQKESSSLTGCVTSCYTVQLTTYTENLFQKHNRQLNLNDQGLFHCISQ